MTHFHADALRHRMRVSVHHHSHLCPIPSGTEYCSLDDAIHALGRGHLGWNPDVDAVRLDFCLVLFNGTYHTDYCFHADLTFRDYAGRIIKPDVVIQRMKHLIELSRTRPRRSFRDTLLYRKEDFRNGPVPFTGKGYRGRIRRHIKTTAERREAAWVAFDEDVAGVGLRARAKRSFRNLPEYRDDIYRSDCHDHGWKSNRKYQWR
jgi:hypothetical protein